MFTKRNDKNLTIILLTIFILFSFNCLFVNADDVIPIGPPENGPSVQGNFNINYTGQSINQIYNKYPNVQIITDGNNKGNNAQSMWWHNKLDITKPFTIKFYAYLSPSKNSADTDSNGLPLMADGITFTLQNDSRGNNAIGQSGDDLGVYGDYSDINSYNSSSINNAFSYEFDPYFNGDNGLYTGTHSSDYNLKTKDGNGDPINNSNPPGDNGQHTAFTTTNYGTKKIYGNDSIYSYLYQQHYDARPLTAWNLNNLVPKTFFQQFAKNWHQIIYKWDPSNPGNGSGTATVNIDPGINSIQQKHTININDILAPNQNSPYVWWGFTGSTGADTMVSAIADTEVTGDPGITKLVLDLSKLSDNQKNSIKDDINNYDYSNNQKKDLINCIDNPSDSSSNPDLSNQLVQIIDKNHKDYFKAVIGDNTSANNNSSINADIGDILLYKVDIYNYADKDNTGQLLGNPWNDVTVHDKDLSDKGMKSLDNQDYINAYYKSIPVSYIRGDNKNQPSSVGLRTIITSDNNVSNPRSNSVIADGGNFMKGNNVHISGDSINRSSSADVYVNSSLPFNAKPRIVIDNKISDSKVKNDIDNNLQNVNRNDNIQYNINLKNIVQQNSSTSDNSTYSFWVPSMSKINNIKINNGDSLGNKISSGPYYQISDNSDDKKITENSLNGDNLNDNNKRLITIHNIKPITYNNDVNISANISLGNNKESSFSSNPVFHDGNSNNYYVGNKENYNFNLGNLELKYPKEIDYGLSNGYLSDGFISPYRLSDVSDPSKYQYNNTNNYYNVAQMIDTRINKIPYSLYLSQENSSDNNNFGHSNSPFTLKFFDHGTYHDIMSPDSFLIYRDETKNDDGNDKTDNINWNNDHELRLIGNSSFHGEPKNESYNANLNWTVKDDDTP